MAVKPPGVQVRTDFSTISSILNSALKHIGVSEDINRYRFTQHWVEIVGDSIAKKSRPETLRNGILKVRVADSSWAQELTFHKQAILKRIKRFVPENDAPSDVQFYVGEI